MKIRIVLCQKQLGTPVTHAETGLMLGFRPHFVCFPEYFFVNRRLGNHGQTIHNQRRQLARMAALSKMLGAVVIGGTMPEPDGGLMHNTSHVFFNGSMLGRYRKRHLFFAEEGKITPGDSYRVFSAFGITFGVLICADVFHDSGFQYMKEMGARVIFIPTFSLKRDETADEKFRRDNDIFVRGAGIADAPLVKVCGVRSPYKDFLQARSLIADKNGVIYRVQPEEEDREMIIMREIEIAVM
jgi:predicted amidohydrolase